MKVDGRVLKLAVHPVLSLYPHEETSEPLLRALTKRMADEGVQKDPMIVDGTSRVILDGMHRHAALGILGVPYAACFELEYKSSSIGLFRWLRYLGQPSRAAMERVIEVLQLSRDVSASEATRAVESGLSPVALLWDGRGFVCAGKERAKEEAWTMVKEFDKVVSASSERVEIIEEGRAQTLGIATGSALLLTPRLSKEEVVAAGISRRLFPLKTTLHVLPMRVVGVDVPISSLKEKRAAEAAVERITSSARMKVLDPPAKYEGRVYKERLVVLD